MMVFQLINVWFEAGVTFSPIEILLNLTFVFNFIPHLTDGIVPASWSIGVEMVFYSILPALLLVNRSILSSFVLLLLSIAMATHFSIDMRGSEASQPGFVYHNFVANLPYFMWGMMAFHVYVALRDYVSVSKHKYISWLCLLLALVSPFILLVMDSE
jgi:peptidoglycan/LPS O-acetylase OafA/YrhL